MPLSFRFLSLTSAALFPGAVAAQDALDPQGLEIIGAPTPGAIGFQEGVTKVAQDAMWLDGFLLVIITVITLFVLALLSIVIIRYNQNRNKEPATFTHNQPLEFAWTFVPIVILIFIGAFRFLSCLIHSAFRKPM